MSLNTIQLQEFIVGELYKENLLAAKSAASADGGQSLAPAGANGAVHNSQPPTSSNSAQSQPAALAPPTQPAAPTTQPSIPSSPAKPSLGSIAATMSQTAVAKTPSPVTAQQPTAPPTAAPQPTPETSAPYKTLGNHRRKITILVNAPGSPFLPDNQLSFLTKILEACRLNMGDVAIVNHAPAPVNITALRAQLQPSVILLFGLEPTTIRLPINFPVFKLQLYDQCTYLSAPALDLLVQTSEESKLLKSKLWLCLKSLFEV
jgi:hypothetical protein